MFSTDFIFRQQENLIDNQKCWAGFRPLCNKILLLFSNEKILFIFYWGIKDISLMIFLKMYWPNLAEKGLRIIGIFLNTFACSHNLLGIILVKIT